MDRVSTGSSGTPAMPPRWSRRLLLFGAIAAAAAVLATFGILRTSTPVRGEGPPTNCPEGTLPFFLSLTFPGGSPLPPLDIPPNPVQLEIVQIPGNTAQDPIIIQVSACLAVPPVSTPGAPPGIFTTPTPGVPLTFKTPTPVPPTSVPAPPTATSVATSAAGAGATVSGIRPPSTGDAGLAGGGTGGGVNFVYFALSGGLAIGAGLSLRRERASDSGRGGDTGAS